MRIWSPSSRQTQHSKKLGATASPASALEAETRDLEVRLQQLRELFHQQSTEPDGDFNIAEAGAGAGKPGADNAQKNENSEPAQTECASSQLICTIKLFGI